MAGQPIPNLPSAEAQCGCWRIRERDGKWTGIYVYPGEGRLWRIEGVNVAEEVDQAWTERRFAWAARHPILYEEFEGSVKGLPWADEKPASTSLNANQPNPVELLADQIKSLEQQKIEIADDVSLAAAQGYRSRANELAREADKHRADEKEPHLKAGKSVDERWMPVVKRAKAVADGILDKMNVYETAKLKAAKEAALKAAEEAAQELPASTTKRIVKASYGKATSSKVEKYAVVEDWASLAYHFSDDEDVRALVQKKADKAVAAGLNVPGCRVEERAAFR
jgi:hypothetical protein